MNDSLKKIGLFAGGVLFGTAGVKVFRKRFSRKTEKKLPKHKWSISVCIHSR
ncbi:MAG: hypothetical protein IKI37_01655 [Oscillospiraceae bacterium]|nr:hypothetical protein [Oscillospiraceae bacterium]